MDENENWFVGFEAPFSQKCGKQSIPGKGQQNCLKTHRKRGLEADRRILILSQCFSLKTTSVDLRILSALRAPFPKSVEKKAFLKTSTMRPKKLCPLYKPSPQPQRSRFQRTKKTSMKMIGWRVSVRKMYGSHSESDDFCDTGALQRRVPSRDTEKPSMKMIGQFAKCTDPTGKVMIWAPQGTTTTNRDSVR